MRRFPPLPGYVPTLPDNTLIPSKLGYLLLSAF